MRKSRQNAFTLIEVLGSMVILAGAIVGVILCNADGLAASKNIERKVKSTLLAESEMERIKGSLAQDFNQTYNNNDVGLGENYFYESLVSNVPSRPELKYVRVSVGHDTNSNGKLSNNEIMFTLVTQVAEQE